MATAQQKRFAAAARQAKREGRKGKAFSARVGQLLRGGGRISRAKVAVARARTGARSVRRVTVRAGAAVAKTRPISRAIFLAPEISSVGRAASNIVGGMAPADAMSIAVGDLTAMRSGFRADALLGKVSIDGKAPIAGWGPWVSYSLQNKALRLIGTTGVATKREGAVARILYHVPEIVTGVKIWNGLRFTQNPGQLAQQAYQRWLRLRTGVSPGEVPTVPEISGADLLAGRGPFFGYRLIKRGLAVAGIRAPRGHAVGG